MRIVGVAMVSFGVVLAPVAQGQTIPKANEGEMESLLEGHALETRVDGDLNGDGTVDIALVRTGEDSRELVAAVTERDQFGFGRIVVGKAQLDPSAVGSATLKIVKGVLTVDELSGGTSVTSSTYRFRYVPAAKKMQLIGIDASYYSRTFSHDGFEFSWNLLTGDLVTQNMKLDTNAGDTAYLPGRQIKAKRVTKPVFMEQTPDAAELVMDAMGKN